MHPQNCIKRVHTAMNMQLAAVLQVVTYEYRIYYNTILYKGQREISTGSTVGSAMRQRRWCGWQTVRCPRMKIALTRWQAGQMVYPRCRFRCQKVNPC